MHFRCISRLGPRNFREFLSNLAPISRLPAIFLLSLQDELYSPDLVSLHFLKSATGSKARNQICLFSFHQKDNPKSAASLEHRILKFWASSSPFAKSINRNVIRLPYSADPSILISKFKQNGSSLPSLPAHKLR